MTQHVPLTPISHAGLRVRTDRSAALGDGVMHAPVFPHEFRQLQAHYPIVFAHFGAEKRLRPVALFGLQTGSNLFLNAAGWDADYIPVAIRMQPFVIGRGPGADFSVHIDVDSPRVSAAHGEALFDPLGKESMFLREMAGILGEIHAAEQALPGFCAMLTELELVEPFTLEVTLDSGEEGRLTGYMAIAEERLYGLDGETLGRLQAAGFLQPIFMAVASLSQMVALIRRRNALDAVTG